MGRIKSICEMPPKFYNKVTKVADDHYKMNSSDDAQVDPFKLWQFTLAAKPKKCVALKHEWAQTCTTDDKNKRVVDQENESHLKIRKDKTHINAKLAFNALSLGIRGVAYKGEGWHIVTAAGGEMWP